MRVIHRHKHHDDCARKKEQGKRWRATQHSHNDQIDDGQNSKLELSDSFQTALIKGDISTLTALMRSLSIPAFRLDSLSEGRASFRGQCGQKCKMGMETKKLQC